ncbi:ubiquitin-related modifier 1 homolog [Trichogramma pretiosum]|uniref:Ubiquitin-related modifier 1 homolog n=1 Tax=Trichogramma kaykai TaxID=54128 RepID=A0ABD2WFZ9_9HYME|nr:ubiquitin-related modifier 1 homolog [Trichogramma pretiosum]
MNQTDLPIVIEFGGGAEYLFDNKTKHNIVLPAKPQWTLGELILWMRDNMLQDKEREDLFVQDETIRPGILVLVNETDWELLDEGNYKLQPNDNVLFISTLHGG